MNLALILGLCLFTWLLTLARLRTIRWVDIRRDNGIALHVSLMMWFFSITMIFLVKDISNAFNAATISNLDRLISYSSILIGIFFGASATVEAVGKQADRATLRLLRVALILTLLVLFGIYALFISRLPNIDYFVPRSPAESLFMLVAFSYGAVSSVFVARVYFAYLPTEESPIMRARVILIVVSSWIAAVYFLVKIVIVGGFVLPVLGSQWIIDLSSALLVLAALTHLSVFLDSRLYVPIVLAFKRIEAWAALNDLTHLAGRLHRLCPEVVLPVSRPVPYAFLRNPEYHLYRAVIAVMDGKTMLDDLLLEGALHGELTLWEGDMLREAVQVKKALQSIDSAGDFWSLVRGFQRVSQSLKVARSLGDTWQVVQQ